MIFFIWIRIIFFLVHKHPSYNIEFLSKILFNNKILNQNFYMIVIFVKKKKNMLLVLLIYLMLFSSTLYSKKRVGILSGESSSQLNEY